MTIHNRSELERYVNEEFQTKWTERLSELGRYLDADLSQNEEFQTKWEERLGEFGHDLTYDLRQVVDLILIGEEDRVKELAKAEIAEIEERLKELVEAWTKELVEERAKELVDEVIEARVASWALQGSDEKVPVSKLDKEGIIRVLFAPDFMTSGERVELAQALLEDVKKRGFTEGR